MSNVIEPSNKLDYGNKYHNNTPINILKIQESGSSTNQDVSNFNYSINAGELNGEYSGTDENNNFIFKILKETTLTGTPEKKLNVDTRITLTNESSKNPMFVLNSSIIDPNSNPSIGELATTGIVTGMNTINKFVKNPFDDSAIPQIAGNRGKLYKKKTQKRISKRRIHKKSKSKTKKRQIKKQKSKRRK